MFRRFLLLMGIFFILLGTGCWLFEENPATGPTELKEGKIKEGYGDYQECDECCDLYLIDENSVKGISVPAFLKPQIYGSMVSCLAHYESTNNPEAIGDDGRAFGILQFHRPTFQQYCVDRYSLPNDIWDPEIQKTCCDYMLQDDFDNVVHWSVHELCL